MLCPLPTMRLFENGRWRHSKFVTLCMYIFMFLICVPCLTSSLPLGSSNSSSHSSIHIIFKHFPIEHISMHISRADTVTELMLTLSIQDIPKHSLTAGRARERERVLSYPNTSKSLEQATGKIFPLFPRPQLQPCCFSFFFPRSSIEKAFE